MKNKVSSKSQRKTILKAMLSYPEKNYWIATDFQHEPYFVGYEASPRMSELKNDFPELFIVKSIDRFRALSIDWENKELIAEVKDKYGIL